MRCAFVYLYADYAAVKANSFILLMLRTVFQVVGYFVYYRFINPALVSPDAYGLLDAPLTPAQAKNVIVLAKVLQVKSYSLKIRHIFHISALLFKQFSFSQSACSTGRHTAKMK